MLRVHRTQDEETRRVSLQQHDQCGPFQTSTNPGNASALVNPVPGSPSNRTAPEMMDRNDGNHAVVSSSNAAPENPTTPNALSHNPTQQPSP